MSGQAQYGLQILKRLSFLADRKKIPIVILTIPRGTERILLVDDEESICRIKYAMLSSLGYQVTALSSSMDSLEAFRRQPDNFDLVITDMTMPNMTGSELALRIMAFRADVPIIL